MPVKLTNVAASRFFRSMTSVADGNSTSKRKAISYIVVGINTIEESKKIFKFLRLNGYKDVSLFSNFPEIKGTELPITPQDPKTETYPFSRILGFPSPLGKIAYQNSSDVVSADQESSSKIPTEEPRGTGFCCVLCGKIRPLLNARNSPKKLEQNIIFLSCLLMENVIDMEIATKLYKETFVTFRRLCQKHFVRAAAFIGREIKEMTGKFPIFGLHNVPKEILEVFLGHLQVFGDCLDEKVVLETYDVIRFFNDCLARYHSAEEWGVAEMQGREPNLRKRRELSPSSDVPEKVKAPNLVGRKGSFPDCNPSPLFCDTKREPSDFDGISAADLMLDQSEPSPCSSMSFDSSYANKVDGEECEWLSAENGIDRARPSSEKLRGVVIPCMVVSGQSSSSAEDMEFRRCFRMSRNTYKKLCDALEPWLVPRWKHSTKSSTAIRIGVALEILAGKGSIKELDQADTHDAGDAAVPEIFSDVLDALVDWSGKVIQWPGEGEREQISKSFFEMTGVDGVIGCLDGTVVDLLSITDASNSSSHALNVSLVTDDQMKIRWVFAKFHSDVNDNAVFKRSLLCEQLKEGTKKGILIGDDAYVDESFLLTPSGQSDPLRADKLREAHRTAQDTIESWKRQFPILCSNIRSSKAARIIVGSAALYNLTRLEGEPVFTAEEGGEITKRLADEQ